MKLTYHDLPKFKSPSAFVTFNSGEKDCLCGHWGESDSFGYCMDEQCRHNRAIAAVRAGNAQMLSDGTFVWFHS